MLSCFRYMHAFILSLFKKKKINREKKVRTRWRRSKWSVQNDGVRHRYHVGSRAPTNAVKRNGRLFLAFLKIIALLLEEVESEPFFSLHFPRIFLSLHTHIPYIQYNTSCHLYITDFQLTLNTVSLFPPLFFGLGFFSGERASVQ